MDDTIGFLLPLIPALPLAGSILVAVLGPRWLRNQSHFVIIATLLLSAIFSATLLREVSKVQSESASTESPRAGHPLPKVDSFERIVTLWTWANVPQAFRQTKVPPGEAADSIVDGGMRDFRIDVVLRADSLTAMMLTMVTAISTLVALFAAGYMHGDRSYWRFFAYFGLFVFSMTMLVSVSNFVLLFVFWEAVGVCSYLLIGFWYEKSEAAAAGKKAFLVNRIGDFGFALAIFLIWTTYGTLNFHDSLSNGETSPQQVDSAVQAVLGNRADAAAPAVVRGVLGRSRIHNNDYHLGITSLAICVLLLLGACGKSAQFPLHVWLPDAMEGPTPVSALIHAATMVTAGVYMVARCTPLFMVSPDAQLIVASIGGITALLAGCIAMTQYDLKRVLAYSTVSQLGYMFLGLGVGTFTGITSAMFHLFTHAFFKALLFLGAGSVMHAMGNVIDMRRFGGLRRIMPVTHWTFLAGCLALAGIPFFSGFWSKDGIVGAVEDKVHQLQHELEHRHTPGPEHPRLGQTQPFRLASVRIADGLQTDAHQALFARYSDRQLSNHARVYQWLFYLAMLTAFLTAFYTFRAFLMTFYGEERIPHEAGHHAHESPRIMSWPLIVLAVFSVVLGLYFDRTYFVRPTHLFAEFLRFTPSLSDGLVAATAGPYQFHKFAAGLSSLVACGGAVLAVYLYLGDQTEIRWLKSLMNFELFGRFGDVESASRISQIPWVAKLYRMAQSVGMGWLAALIGNILLLVVLILAAPLTLGNYIAPYKLSRNRFYFDELYEVAIVAPLRFLAGACYVFDRSVVDGIVNLLGRIPVSLGGLMRSLQMGLVQFYAMAMVLGVLVLLAVRILWAT